jgi:hypothetical protein
LNPLSCSSLAIVAPAGPAPTTAIFKKHTKHV